MTESSAGKRVAVASAKAAAATIALGIAVATIGAAALLPLPTTTVTAPSVEVTPVPTQQLAVCPGGLLRLGDEDGTNADTATSIGESTITHGSDLDESTLDGPGAPTLLTSSTASAVVSGSQSQRLTGSSTSGFVAAACSRGSTDSWLVGGSTATGRTTIITLANPTDVAATVALDIFGEAGATDAPGTVGIVVEPHTQRVLPLAGFAPDTVSPVVHVTSTGGLVAASLQQSVVRGLEAAGADIAGASARPATSVTIPGVVLAAPEDVEARLAADASGTNADLTTVLRLFVPGTAAGTATVSVVPEGGAASGGTFSVDLPARQVLDVPLEGIDAGTFRVSVSSDVPVVGAVRTSTVSTPDGGEDTSDFDWIASPSTLAEPSAFAVSPGPSPMLHLANATDAATTVALTAPDGTTSEVAVPAGESVSVAMVAGSWQLDPTAPVVATVGYSSTSQLASYPVEPRLPNAEPIVVYP